MDDALRNSDRIRQFWESYKAVAGVDDDSFAMVQFGDSAELATSLASLVVAGTKRASTSLASDHRGADQPLPVPGDLYIVIDGHGEPRCVVRIVSVEMKRLGDVDSSFAWDEGEGDRTLEWWMSSHKRYFARQLASGRRAVDDDTEIILERFEVVWPFDMAGRDWWRKFSPITRT